MQRNHQEDHTGRLVEALADLVLEIPKGTLGVILETRLTFPDGTPYEKPRFLVFWGTGVKRVHMSLGTCFYFAD